ncbi:solute carrier family 2, facilitated glucose transporter member 12 [Trichonephila inaurata madagascariensis]|uniref:Solute carrier family 2, facilitated glucose transporter member 12 n=1 Tax=Trichonephila inaurata madagascariensis TaxID=2747483 RepID=A0A8X6WTT8_9ARAC|nr:solute carrier family 2, facilitated glucose transporter member 12 [Trichonephila inaurata madagascariensis]
MKDKPHLNSESCEKKNGYPMYVIFGAVVASVGGVLFGYDIGITSGALLQLRDDFNLTSFEQELVVSSVLVGALCASFFGGNIVDTWGRKAGIGLSCILFIIGAVVLFFSVSVIMILIGRLIVGIAVSLSVTSECTYISEISPPNRRGMMVSLNEVGITHGWRYMFGAAVILAIIQGIGVTFMPNSHHYLLVKGETDKARKVLSLLRDTDDVDKEMDGILTSIQEKKNRRYFDLFSTSSNMRGRMFLGMTLVFLQQFSGNANVLYYAPTVFQHFGYSTDALAMLVTVGLGIVKVISTMVTLAIVDKVGRRTLLLTGCILMATSIMILGTVGTIRDNQIKHEGKKPIIIHHTVIIDPNMLNDDFNSMGNPNKQYTESELLKIKLYHHSIATDDLRNSSEQNSLDEMLEFMSQLPNYDLINNMSSISSQEDNLLTNTTLKEKENFDNHRDSETTKTFSLLQMTHNAIPTNSVHFELVREKMSVVEEENPSNITLPAKITSVVSLMVFVCAYSMSYGPVTWLVLSEIFPGSLRGRAVSVATCINWGSNIIVSVTFLDVLNAVGIGPTFVVYGFISYAAAIFIYMCVPETKNKTLEEIDALLSNGLLQKDLKVCFCALNHQKYSVEDTNSAINIIPNKTLQEQQNYKYLEEIN